MESLVFATNNPHKLQEIRSILTRRFDIVGLNDIGCSEELPENQDTLEGNSLEKARFVLERYGRACFADDTGLEVVALGGAPGVFSARFAGPHKSAEDNVAKLLRELKGTQNRSARFRTVIALTTFEGTRTFEGIMEGSIAHEPRGMQGFGYDPVFIPTGFQQTFAEMPFGLKNKISHRARAIHKLVDYLQALKS